mmetsp:Transcript_67753/g.180406  ORF Transcript_67753/g.180406 Transcript_67753/m.180406 type:complete len:266 (+) Transcript_67753:300-1097(+)
MPEDMPEALASCDRYTSQVASPLFSGSAGAAGLSTCSTGGPIRTDGPMGPDSALVWFPLTPCCGVPDSFSHQGGSSESPTSSSSSSQATTSRGARVVPKPSCTRPPGAPELEASLGTLKLSGPSSPAGVPGPRPCSDPGPDREILGTRVRGSAGLSTGVLVAGDATAAPSDSARCDSSDVCRRAPLPRRRQRASAPLLSAGVSGFPAPPTRPRSRPPIFDAPWDRDMGLDVTTVPSVSVRSTAGRVCCPSCFSSSASSNAARYSA